MAINPAIPSKIFFIVVPDPIRSIQIRSVASVGPQKRFRDRPIDPKSARNIATLVRKAVSEMQHSPENCGFDKLMNVHAFS